MVCRRSGGAKNFPYRLVLNVLNVDQKARLTHGKVLLAPFQRGSYFLPDPFNIGLAGTQS